MSHGKTIDWRRIADQLGKQPDAVIAKRLKVSRQSVHQARKKLGIQAFGCKQKLPYEQLLGTLTDAEIARRFKRTPSTVRAARIWRGINAYRKDRQP